MTARSGICKPMARDEKRLFEVDFTADFEAFHFNTAVAATMELVNATRTFLESLGGEEPSRQERAAISEAVENLVLLLAPMVPHVSEEIWERNGGSGSVFEAAWPTFDELAAAEDVVTIAVQINGKLRAEVEAERGAAQDEVLELAMADERVQKHVEGKTVRKVIHVPDRILNLVVG